MRMMTAPLRWFASTRVFHSLRFRLLLLVALATLPALGFLFLTSSQQRDDAIATAQQDANLLVDLVATEQRGIIDQTQQLLTVLARLPETRATDPAQCNAITADLESSEESRYAAIGVVTRTGSVFCGAPVSGVVVDDYTAIWRALDDGVFSIGNFQTSPTGEPTLTFATPVRNSQGEIIRAVFASLDLSITAGFSQQSNLPENTIVMILDSRGTLLYRQPPEDDISAGTSLVGTPIVDAVTSGDAEFDDSQYVYGSERIGATETVAGSAYIIVARPRGDVVAEANSAFQTNVTRLGVAVLVAVIAAWVGADFFIARDGETRKSLISELYHAYSRGSVNDLDDLFAEDYVDRSPAPGQRKGLEGVKQVVAAFRAAFPDGTITPRELLADRDKVVARVTMTGTHLGEYYGKEPTGERVTADGVETFRFVGGSIVESWSLFSDFVPAVNIDDQDQPVTKRSFWHRLQWWRR